MLIILGVCCSAYFFFSTNQNELSRAIFIRPVAYRPTCSLTVLFDCNSPHSITEPSIIELTVFLSTVYFLRLQKGLIMTVVYLIIDVCLFAFDSPVAK
jgi:hypothetical protein